MSDLRGLPKIRVVQHSFCYLDGKLTFIIIYSCLPFFPLPYTAPLTPVAMPPIHHTASGFSLWRFWHQNYAESIRCRDLIQ